MAERVCVYINGRGRAVLESLVKGMHRLVCERARVCVSLVGNMLDICGNRVKSGGTD